MHLPQIVQLAVEQLDFGWAKTLKISEAMSIKRKIGVSCNLDAKMLDTSEEGMVLTIEKRAVNADSLQLMKDFVTQHNLNLLSESGRYFISSNALKPSIQPSY